ncbi:cellulose biosynthesis cyclic di-GMP-binding regulatory protein BcsB [Hoyosella sp. YIM 151337]|uniref:cellulose biosynthesis cyclic di-GMP-binding regulatory protein BcsB n=1 Tax=Hoyosella sp. YIM 151337 TaxID=2992742 RepID=UPI002236A7B9|nr:cellulose biosynthesis cyclic di-GMP-binding regulatory protein BcsB [Hoyosella sp. YIM 151337]MCW4353629.1 cellulose biosynthesis cyclic di-GMP-binding regulatory protein BcsB [Hoyosella sp. YIM 151337]
MQQCSPRSWRRAWAVGPVALAMAVTTLVGAPAASAEVDITSQDLGLGDAITFFGDRDTSTLTLAVPPGTAPEAMLARVETPPDAAGGWIDVHSAGRLLSRTEFSAPAPADDAPPEILTPVVLPLSGAELGNGEATVELRTTVVPAETECFTFWDRPTATLRDIIVRYSGDEAQPPGISEFLPPALRQLTIALPAEPSESEVSAAIAIAAAVTHRYRAHNVRVDVQPLADRRDIPDLPIELLSRRVIVTEAAETELELLPLDNQVATLRVAGSGPELANQARLLSNNLLALATGTSLAISGDVTVPRIAPRATTLSELGLSGLTATGVGRVAVSIPLDQTRIGFDAAEARVGVKGAYTPLPTVMNGRITARIGDREVGSWPMTADGRIDEQITIPRSLLTRFSTLTMTAEIAGESLACGRQQPVTLTIDSASTIEFDEATPPPPIFDSLPQAFIPTVHAALPELSFGNADRLISIVTGLQRQSATPFHTEITTAGVQTGLPSILIVDENTAVPLPLPLETSGTAFLAESADGVVTLDLGTGEAPPYGALQVAQNGNALALVASGDNTLLDTLITWLDDDPARWAGLNGNVVVQLPQGEPQVLSIGATEATAADGDTETTMRLVVTGALVALAAGIVTAAVIGLRRRGTAKPQHRPEG